MKIKIDRLDELHFPLGTSSPKKGFFDIEKILNPIFMSKHSEFSSIQEMFDTSGFSIRKQDDLQKTLDAKFDIFVDKKTDFVCRNEMVMCAGKEFLKNRISDI